MNENLNLTDESAIYQRLYSIKVTAHVLSSVSSAAAGDTVSLSVTPETGFVLSTLALDKGSLNERVSSSTLLYTFTMPASNVVVSATYSAAQSNNVSGGGGGGTAQTQTIPVSGNGSSISLNVTLSGKLATLSLGTSDLSSLIFPSSNITFDLSSLDDISGVVIPSGMFSTVSGANTLTISLADASVTFEHTSLMAIAAAGGGDVTLTATSVDPKTLSAKQQTLIGSHPVISLSLTSGSTVISKFGGGTVKLSLPYTLGANENPDTIVVWCISDSGIMDAVTGNYDPDTKSVVFTVKHFSKYAVGILPFTDFSRDDWYFDSVSFAYANGLITGTGASEFDPNLPMTRAMLITVLWRLADSPKAQSTGSFSGEPSDMWYSYALSWALENGIVMGYGNGSFGANNELTREQMAVIIVNYAKYKGYDVSTSSDLSSFTDRDSVSSWAKNAMLWAYGKNLVSGTGGGLLSPHSNATRCQIAAILQRFIENIVSK